MTNQRMWIVGLLLAAVVLVTACGSANSPAADDASNLELVKNSDGYADINVEQLKNLQQEGDVVVVNVHIPYEGEIPNTDLFIAYDEILSNLDKLPDKNASIVLYCRSGSMSTSAALDLVSEGYTNVMELDGGFNAWKAAGYELKQTH